MNAPGRLRPPPLPPLAPYRPFGQVPQSAPDALGLQPTDLSSGLASLGLTQDPKQAALGFACDPTPLDDPILVSVSPAASALIGLKASDLLQSPGWQALLSGSATLAGQTSYASVYAGHQFGVFVPRLGDGRAINLGCVRGWELQLKGAGSTPYARHADGRAVLRSSIREFLCSEFMAALGVPTTRALSLVSARTPVFREAVETAAVVCRMAPSFVRFGHFEYLASQGQTQSLQQLIDHLVATQPLFAQTAEEAPGSGRNWAFFSTVSLHTARLMADWTAEGFMHGVMNTDNFSILGLTLDYGPFGWMEGFSAGHICNHTDSQGRYAFGQQPSVGLWNLQRLLVALSTIDPGQPIEKRNEALIEQYQQAFQTHFHHRMAKKLGLDPHLPTDQLESLLQGLYGLLSAKSCDFPTWMRNLSRVDLTVDPAEPSDFARAYGALADHGLHHGDLVEWLQATRQAWNQSAASSPDLLQDPTSRRTAWQAALRRANPAFVLRNWVAQEIIEAAQEGDWSALHDALVILSNPFDDHLDKPHRQHWRNPPPDWAAHLEVSCSS